jgi:hypothetical protein
MAATVDNVRLVDQCWCFTVSVDPPEHLPGVLAVLIQAIPMTERTCDADTQTWRITHSARNKAILRSMFTNFARAADALRRQGTLHTKG